MSCAFLQTPTKRSSKDRIIAERCQPKAKAQSQFAVAFWKTLRNSFMRTVAVLEETCYCYVSVCIGRLIIVIISVKLLLGLYSPKNLLLRGNQRSRRRKAIKDCLPQKVCLYIEWQKQTKIRDHMWSA